MSRVKTFDATGIPPGGRLFAGDMNSIQDHYADAANFAQTVDLATLRLGDTAIQLVKFGTGEARLTAALRTDGILRGLGGLFAGAYTSTQRDAIAAGFRPFTLVIFNTTANRFEWNAGTDAAPNWQPISDANAAVPIGSTMDWPWAAASLPSNYLLPYGQAILRSAYPALAAIASASGYPWGNGDGSTTFNLPDYRGRDGLGKDDMGGTAAGRVTTGGSGINGITLGASGGAEVITLTSGQIPAHSHGVTGAPGVGNLTLPNHGHVHSLSLPQHTHAVSESPHGHGLAVIGPGNIAVSGGWDSAYALMPGYAGNSGFIYGATTGLTVQGVNSFPGVNGSVDGVSSSPGIGGAPSIGSLATSNTGGGASHSNMIPAIIVNKAMRVL